MKIKLLSICLLLQFSLNSQTRPIAKDIILELNQTSSTSFKKYIKIFDTYINANPTDIEAKIEKCRFLQTAQYNESEEYNPNQDLFDSFSMSLYAQYPTHPSVLIYHIENTWDEEKASLLDTAEILFDQNKEWTAENKAFIYSEKASKAYYDDEFKDADEYMKKAKELDLKYSYSILAAQINIALKKNKLALAVLNDKNDTTTDLGILSLKADLYLELKDYTNAMRLYDFIEAKDSNYNNDEDIAKALIGARKYDLARKFLLVDTSIKWNLTESSLKLFLHDLTYHNTSLALKSYNAYRDIGYSSDPLGIYRLKLFFKDPFLAWKFRDLLGILSFMGVLLFLCIAPYLWILPIYSFATKFNPNRFIIPEKFNWGLKTFWFISFGYLICYFISYFIEPEAMKDLFGIDNHFEAFTEEYEAKINLFFIALMTFFTILTLKGIKIDIFKSSQWSLGKIISHVIVIYFAYNIYSKIYMNLGFLIFDNRDEYDLASKFKEMLSAEQEVLKVLNTYGLLVSWLSFAIIVPIYEEIIFRGVVLHSTQKYLDFKWANMLQSLLFAAIHQDLFLIPVFFGFGLVCGYLTRKSESLLPSILFHILNNTLVTLAIYFFNKYSNLVN